MEAAAEILSFFCCCCCWWYSSLSKPESCTTDFLSKSLLVLLSDEAVITSGTLVHKNNQYSYLGCKCYKHLPFTVNSNHCFQSFHYLLSVCQILHISAICIQSRYTDVTVHWNLKDTQYRTTLPLDHRHDIKAALTPNLPLSENATQ